jgi:hypothetical protein
MLLVHEHMNISEKKRESKEEKKKNEIIYETLRLFEAFY